MKKIRKTKWGILLLSLVLLTGCGSSMTSDYADSQAISDYQTSIETHSTSSQEEAVSTKEESQEKATEQKKDKKDKKDKKEKKSSKKQASFDLSKVPSYSGVAYAVVNNNQPYFTKKEISKKAYEDYGKLDSLGRCTAAMACLGQETMPTEERGAIGSVKPTGWHTVKYQGVDGNYLYNRCHLIAFCLGAENANEKNLITGTRYMNVEGMLPFEEETAAYIDKTNNHVMYRVTPIFEGDNLLASGVLMEAYSVEDEGKGIEFCVYCYNVQPDVTIDYATGDSKGREFTGSQISSKDNKTTSDSTQDSSHVDYILNTNSKKFHKPACSSVKSMAKKNTKKYNGTRNKLIDQGYEPCGNCHP